MNGTTTETKQEAKTRHCDNCWEKEMPESEMIAVEMYDHPFDDAAVTRHFCSEKCQDAFTDGGDFAYFTCRECGRLICQQNPSNGWMTQYRNVNECEQICLKCYEEQILRDGLPRKQFEDGQLPGMFFSGDNREPLDAGYEYVIHNRKVNGKGDAKIICDQAVALIDSGHQIVVGYESMAIGGSEGYVSMFKKKTENHPEPHKPAQINMERVKTHADVDAVLQGKCKQSRKVSDNTYLHRNGGNIALRFHETDVVTWKPDGDIVLDSGGWKTSTTKERINSYIGNCLYQHNGVWFLGSWWNLKEKKGSPIVFADGIVIHKDGTVTGYREYDPHSDKLLKRRIKEYAQKCADALPVGPPGGRDCWFCAMKTDNGSPWGDTSKDVDHLRNHMKESYVVPSLIYNALIEKGFDPQRNFHFYVAFTKDDPKCGPMMDHVRIEVRNSVYSYISKRFGFAGGRSSYKR